MGRNAQRTRKALYCAYWIEGKIKKEEYHTVSLAEEIGEIAHLAEIFLEETLSGPDQEEWMKTMATEWKSIIKNDTWILMDRSLNQKVISSRVVLKNKYSSDGKV